MPGREFHLMCRAFFMINFGSGLWGAYQLLHTKISKIHKGGDCLGFAEILDDTSNKCHSNGGGGIMFLKINILD